jgi:hypothetical protein
MQPLRVRRRVGIMAGLWLVSLVRTYGIRNGYLTGP